ncbi:MAG: type II secretion system protein [Phycisphaerae bacterium]
MNHRERKDHRDKYFKVSFSAPSANSVVKAQSLKPKACPLAPAFTMIELMVATLVLILILGITASIYKSAGDAMTYTNAAVNVSEDTNTLVRQLDLTLKNIYTDGYLVIYGDNLTGALAEKKSNGQTAFTIPWARSDAVCFFTTGNFKSLTNSGVSANSGWTYLGHAGTITPSTYGTWPFDTLNPLTVNRWALSKYLILFTPGITPIPAGADYRDWSIGGYTPFLATQLLACANAQAVRDWFYKHWINDYYYPLTGGTWPDVPFWGTPPAINFDTGPTFPYTLSNCGSFKIEFAMPASFNNAADSNSQPEIDSVSGQIRWRDALTPGANFGDAAGNVNAGDVTAGSRTGDGIVIFGPNDPWPLFIRFTLRKYDENLSLTSEDPAYNVRHGGQTVEYIYKLPAKQ